MQAKLMRNVVGAAAVLASHWASAATITVSSAQPLSKQVQDLLVSLGESKTVNVPPGIDPYAVIRGHCGGSFTNEYMGHVQKQNEGFQMQVESSTRLLNLPPCIRIAKKDQTIKVQPDDTLSAITHRTFGVKPTEMVQVCDPKGPRPKEFSSCTLPAVKAIEAVNGGKSLEQALYSPGTVLSVPTKSLPTTFVLKAGVQPEIAISQLTAKSAQVGSGTAAPKISGPSGLRIIHPLESDNPIVANSTCALSHELKEPWPIDVSRLAARLGASYALAKSKDRYERSAIIRIADTGFLGLGDFLPTSYFVQNPNEKANQNFDSDMNRHNGDQYGIDADDNGDITPYPDDKYRLHGTQVASTALGGVALRTQFPALHELVKLGFVKIYMKDSGNAITVRDSTFREAIKPIDNHRAPQVVNYSVGAGSRNSTAEFEEDLVTVYNRNFLVVLAAGNSTEDIVKDPSYPASYGGTGSDHSNWIITVGASGPGGGIANFSNRSNSRVDLLAPGCRIPFEFPGEGKVFLNGTSLAAPWVSLTAGALHALGIEKMDRVKLRIMASADFRPELSEFTRFGGIVLNMERALALYDDSIRLKDSVHDVVGTWDAPEGDVEICNGQLMNPRRLLAVSTFEEGGVVRLRVLRMDQDGRMADLLYCEPGKDRIRLSPKQGEPIYPEWKDISTFVPAHRF